jgi:hypothetical protein
METRDHVWAIFEELHDYFVDQRETLRALAEVSDPEGYALFEAMLRTDGELAESIVERLEAVVRAAVENERKRILGSITARN